MAINKQNEAWINKEHNKEKAAEHIKYIQDHFSAATSDSIKETIKYETFKINNTEWADKYTINSTIIPYGLKEITKIQVVNKTTTEAIGYYYKRRDIHDPDNTKTAALNFASYTSPGGKFKEGSFAQEEFLCHHSNLFNVLIQFDKTFYENNRHSVNNHLFHCNALYTPNIVFINHRLNCFSATCDIITCAAPNTRAAMKWKGVSYEDCVMAMIERADFVLNIAYKNHVKNLILGAYGCGVFGNDPTDVAAIFMTLLMFKYKNVFRHVDFAIPYSITNDNNEKFDNVVRTFQAYEVNPRKALSNYELVERLIGDKPWMK